MNTLQKSICLLFIGFVSIARSDDSDEEPTGHKYFSGPEADAEIRDFLRNRWGRQTWSIEYKSRGEYHHWMVKGTMWEVRIDGPERLKGKLNLNELDTTKVYELDGVAVDMNFAAVTFYLASEPKIASVPIKNKDAEQAAP